MKIAICLSGHLRTFEKTAESFHKHLADRYDSCVFIHAWNNYSGGRGDIQTDQKVNPEAVCRAYSPASIVIEPQAALVLNDHPTLHTTPNPPFNVLSKWYSSKRVYELCEEWSHKNTHPFDVVVSCRSDMLFHEDVNIVDRKGVLWTPGGNGSPPGTLHDYFAYGDPTIMRTYFGVYDAFDKIVSELNVSRFRAEEVITHHIMCNRVPLDYCYIEYSLCRLSGEVRRMKA
jgi:hypothetical protein